MSNKITGSSMSYQDLWDELKKRTAQVMKLKMEVGRLEAEVARLKQILENQANAECEEVPITNRDNTR